MTQAPIDPQEQVTPTEPLPGQPDTGTPQYEDYWGTDETFKFVLKDGHQYFEIAPMNEGAKAKFQRKTNRGITMNQKSQDAKLDVDPAGDRWQLIKDSVVSWRIMQRDPSDPSGWSAYPCPTEERRRINALEQLLEKFNPKVVQDLEFFIRTKNPWMQADMDIEEIDEEIARLYELRKQVQEEQAGEGSSANK